MGLPRFIKLPGYKRFNYTPLYWDQEKEERENRIRLIKAEMGFDVPSGQNRSTIKRGSFRQFKQRTKTKAARSSNIRLLVILIALFLIAYLIFFR